MESGSITETIRNHRPRILKLILVSLAVKGAVLLFSPLVGFVDLFDLGNYGRAAFSLAQGQIPYWNFPLEYPPGFLLTLVPSIAIASLFPDPFAVLQAIFLPSFVVGMVICDVVTLLCVYLIGLRIGEEHAWAGGLLYATAFSSAYFVLFRYDAFPVMLLALGMALFLYREESRGYASLVIGGLVKIFPLALVPFLVLMRRESWKSLVKWGIVGGVVALPFILLNPSAFLFPVGGGAEVYAASPMFLLNLVLHAPPLVYSMAAGFILLAFLVYMRERGISTVRSLLASITFVLLIAIVFSPFHSPQYYLWFTPFLALLCVDVMWKGVVFYAAQIFFFLEFPFFFGRLYTNLEYVSPAAGVFFALELGVFLLLGWMVVRDL